MSVKQGVTKRQQAFGIVEVGTEKRITKLSVRIRHQDTSEKNEYESFVVYFNIKEDISENRVQL